MAIHSTPFGPVKITGEDAEAFLRKVRYGRGTKAAKESLVRGLKLVAEFAEKGSATVELKPAKHAAKTGTATGQ